MGEPGASRRTGRRCLAARKVAGEHVPQFRRVAGMRRWVGLNKSLCDVSKSVAVTTNTVASNFLLLSEELAEIAVKYAQPLGDGS